MKNLLIYISPTYSFDNPRSDLADNDAGPLAKVQIDNSLSLGWQKEDVLLVTNFEWEYNGVKAVVLPDVDFFERKPQVSKINAIIKLFEKGLIDEDETYWFHDFDAFQLQPILPEEIDIESQQIALTDYGGGKHFGGEDRWSTGVIYFKSGSFDLFKQIQSLCYQKRIDEEEALGLLVIGDPTIRQQVCKIDCSYNFIGYHLPEVYAKSIKPLKVVHFHPRVGKKRLGSGTALEFFKGNNPLKISLVTNQLLRLLKYHRIGQK